MKFTIQPGTIKNLASDCLIVGVYEDKKLTPAAEHLDKLSKGYISRIVKKGDIYGKIGQTAVLHHVPHLTAECVLLIGCGKKVPLTVRDFRKIIATSVKTLNTSPAERGISYLTELTVEQHDLAWKVKHITNLSADTLYVFDTFRSSKEPKSSVKEIILHIDDARLKSACEKSLKQALAINDGVEFTKNLANLPSNICTPTYVAKQAQALAKKYSKMKIKILEEKDMEKLGMGAFLSVAKGSNQDAKLVCLEYHGGPKNQAPIAFVGKGITFDTGGISIKPAESMVGMKYDMCGSATVLGVLKAAAELKLPLNLVGILALAENMPSGVASKPEDIVTTMSGQTVEILNTDAEGRLVLSDALTYCERFKPKTVIDIATLTGAVVIALGHHATGLISNHEPLAKELLAAGQHCYDRAWQMPLWDEFQDQIKSPFADMANTGGRTGGTITAGCFLSRFTKKFHWAHLDVAGTAAMMAGTDRYATGRPVPMLMEYLLSQV